MSTQLRWEDLLPINSFQLRMSKIIFVILLFAHVNACVQLLVAAIQQYEGERSNFMARLGIVDAGDDVKVRPLTMETHANRLHVMDSVPARHVSSNQQHGDHQLWHREPSKLH